MGSFDMAAEDREVTAQEYRDRIIGALDGVDKLKILQRIYISVLIAKGNHCEIAIRGSAN